MIGFGGVLREFGGVLGSLGGSRGGCLTPHPVARAHQIVGEELVAPSWI